jgi:hypothetical protein
MMHDANVPADVEADSPAGDVARIAAANLTYVRKNHFVRPEDQDAVGVQIGARYDGSPIIVANGEPPADVFPDTYDKYAPSGVPGGRAPHLWLDAGRGQGGSLFDRFGKGFTLLRFGRTAAGTDALEQAAAKRGIPLAIFDVALPEGRELYGFDLALIRPDQYIAWRGDTLPHDLDALLDKVTGQ